MVIDVSNPGQPEIVGGAGAGDFWALAVAVSGDYAYVTAGYADGLQVLDVSYPPTPRVVGQMSTPDWPYAVVIKGDYAYLADHSTGFLIVDISNPEYLWIVGSLNPGGYALGVAVSGPYAYLADYWYGLHVIDVSVPEAPHLVGNEGMAYSEDVVLSGVHAYVATGGYGLQVIDIANPPDPRLVGGGCTLGSARGVDVSGGLAYVADGQAGLQILPTQCDPAGIAQNAGIRQSPALRIVTNPASERAVLHLTVPSPGRARLTIHDVVGRRVRNLIDGVMGAGIHDLFWDGRDDEGRPVAAGDSISVCSFG